VSDAEGSFGKLGGFAKNAGLAVAAGLALGAAGAIKLGGDAISAASDLAETESKVRQLFGGQTAAALGKWSDDAATKLGLSKAAALDAAAGFGNMFTQLGQSAPEAAKTSEKVVQLAADLGSFNNIPTAEAADKISAAFRGEYDSLQSLIPNINAARVEKEALAATGKETADQLTAEEKAMAALKIVTEDGAKAQGDFARTSGGLANQQKTLSANFEDLKATIGEKLLPIATDLVKWANDHMIPAAKELGAYLSKNLGPILGDVADFIQKKVVPAAQDFIKWFIEDLAPGIQKTVTPILDGLRGMFEKIAGKIKENEPELTKLKDAFKEVVEFIYQQVLPVVGDILGKKLELMGDAIGIAIDTVGFIVDIFSDWYDMISDVIGKIQDLIDWIKKIDLGKLGEIGGAIGGLFGRTAATPGGGGFEAGPGGAWGDKWGNPSDPPVVYNFTIQGAIDPVSSARQIRRILAEGDALNGAPDWAMI
jgi:hypothetical protein